MKLILIYLLLINAVSFLLMLMDKYKAKKNLWRIPEATLLWFAVLGGSLGAFIGMRLARHKTRHPRFSVGVPLLLIMHILIAIFLYHLI
jgi:uncharacterized membrane protein YsdA (DUF1294 family)